MPRLSKSQVDVSQVFLTFVALVGDVEKTALALNLDPAFVRRLAEEEGWQLKIERVCLMAKSGKPGDFERAQNRALAFVQAHQVRELMSRVIHRFQEMTGEEILDATSVSGRDGRTMSGRFFADLTAAMEKAHAMAYSALGDTAMERRDSLTPESDAVNATALHLAVMQALNNPKVNGIEIAVEVAKAAEGAVKELAAPATPAEG